MFNLSVPVFEIVARALLVYIFLLIAFRLTGKKQTGELSPFDLIFLLIISESVQNSMISNDTSLLGGLIIAGTLIVANYFLGWLTFRSKKAAKWIEGVPEILVHNGKVVSETMKQQHITHDELMEALRYQGCDSIENVRTAILETNGKISVIRNN
jgi:uncharacterized membrane protein YcaP (DUF421 family)